MNDQELIYKIRRILERADQCTLDGSRIDGKNEAGPSEESKNKENHRLYGSAGGLRSIYFGMAMMIISIIMIQIGGQINAPAFRWAFYLGASVYLISGVIVFDRGVKKLPNQLHE